MRSPSIGSLLLSAIIYSLCSGIYSAGTLHDCCNKQASFADLLFCVNRSSTSSYQHKATETLRQPSLSVTMLTRVTPEIFLYGAYSYLVQNLYAQHNGYTILPLTMDSLRSDYQYHRKLVPLLDALRTNSLLADYYVWVDADLIPLDLNFRVEQIAAQYPQAHILLSKDVSSVANTGCIIVKGTRWAEKFLEDWLAFRDTPGMETEQLGFEAVYHSRSKEEMQSKVAILPAHVLNSIAAPMGQQEPHHKILHLAAESTAMRAEVFRKAAANLCSTLKQNKPPLKQLGISREYLQDTAKRVYGSEFQRVEAKIVHNATIIDIRELAEYRTSVSKYCFAENYAHNFTETPEILQLRIRAHIIVSNFTLSRMRDLATYALDNAQHHKGAVSNVAASAMEIAQQALTVPVVSTWSAHPDLLGYTNAMRKALTAHLDTLLKVIQTFATHARPAVAHCVGSTQAEASAAASAARGTDAQCQHLLPQRHWQDLPETLKLSAEISYELLVAILSAPVAATPRPNIFSPTVEVEDSLPPHRDPRVIEDLLHSVDFCLNVLEKIVHPSQMSIVEHMRNDIDQLVPKIQAVMKWEG